MPPTTLYDEARTASRREEIFGLVNVGDPLQQGRRGSARGVGDYLELKHISINLG